eukprot:CAMPEP_0181330606 /NCGR_PEP_ID=MMETSP1101-20121128/23995_1 /TAXON_ID=46948 /ORGANISM="Rhodomonas abbreviata, Strain Caron Lab Isolate" /LENGTH=327 /DNA_ID=CAMNT_0023439885 /DNA_START=17 /DNA_END=1001 /DNA_ORIENTATION=-
MSGAAATAQHDTETYYYDTDDAYNFYLELWGGEHCHVGIYAPNPEPTPECCMKASDVALEKLMELCTPALQGGGKRAMDMGAAYGGCARALHKKFGCKVVCIELSKRENEVNIQRNQEEKLEDQILVPGELSFDDTKEPSESVDCCVSEDSILHAGKGRPAVVAEAARVLKKGGYFVFSDIMQRDAVDPANLNRVYARLGLEDMGSPAKYIEWAAQAGMRLKRYEDFSSDIASHYGTIKKMLEGPIRDKLRGKVSDAYVESMIEGLGAWVDASNAGNLAWGFFVFEKMERRDAIPSQRAGVECGNIVSTLNIVSTFVVQCRFNKEAV